LKTWRGEQDAFRIKHARELSGGFDQPITPRWLAGGVTRKTGTMGGPGRRNTPWNK